MPLSEEELRLLEQMERALVEEDPKLASTLRGTTMQRAARRRTIVACVVFVLGVAALTTGVVMQQPVVGILGFVVMLGAATFGFTAARHPSVSPTTAFRETKHSGFGVVDGGRKHRPRRTRGGSGSFMERMEQRWQHRRDSGL